MRVRLRHINLVPLAEESFGVRSMAIFIETPDLRVLFDAGVSLAPRRYGLPPHPLEFKAVREARKRLRDYAKRADVITVSHYHRDHYTPGFVSWYEWTNPETQAELYSGKIVIVKHPRTNINYNQLRRAHAFLKAVEPLAERVLYAEETTLHVGDTTLRCLGLSPHGPEGSKLGFVAVFMLETRGEKLVYAPDSQGPISQSFLRLIEGHKEDLIIIGGPPLYLAGKKVPKEDIDAGLRNLAKLASRSTVVTGHHLLRSPDWREALEEAQVSVLTYASLLGREETLLEAYRRELYEYAPPSEEYKRWVEKYRRGRRDEPPPIDL